MGKCTPLYRVYVEKSGVKIVDFEGWDLPLSFAGGILEEHRVVRHDAGLFDVSHMGRIKVQGEGAEKLLDTLLTNRVAGVPPGRCLYSPMCRPEGGVLDDLVLYVLSRNSYLLVVNSANIVKDLAWIERHAAESASAIGIRDRSSEWAQLALQGPRAAAVLSGLTDADIHDLGFYRHIGGVRAAGVEVMISRTGYTGEDGFELYCSSDEAPALWTALEKAGGRPCGLGARDMLRLEARLPLHGHELSETISPLEAGLSRFVKLEKEDFIGRSALLSQKENGVPRRLRGLEMLDPGVPREGCPVRAGKELVGRVTSGGRSPVRKSFIALALLKQDGISVGDEVTVEIHGGLKKALVVKTPFYRR